MFRLILLWIVYLVTLVVVIGKTVNISVDCSPSLLSLSGRSTIPAISQVLVINLDKSVKRLHHMDRLLKKLGIPYQRFRAIDFRNGTDRQYLEKVRRELLHPLTKIDFDMVNKSIHEESAAWWLNWNSMGCWQSHLQTYFQIFNGSLSHMNGPFLILEDDIELSSHIFDLLSYDYLYHYLPDDWETFHLDHYDLKCFENEVAWRRPTTTDKSHRQYCLVKHLVHLGGYVVRNARVAEKLLMAGNSDRWQIADFYINGLFENQVIRAYAPLKLVVRQQRESFGTEIHFTKPGGFH
eukprot:gene13768-15178_t